MASPVRLIGASIRKTPTGAAAERDRDRADERAPHELELGEGTDEEVVEHLKRHPGRAQRDPGSGQRAFRGAGPGSAPCAVRDDVSADQAAHACACGSCASTIRRARRRLSALEHLGGFAPGDRLPRDEQGARKDAPDNLEIVQHGDDGARFLVPAAHQVEEIGGGLGVDRREGLVEQDQRRVLEQEAREQRALHLPARQGRDRPALEAREPDRRHRLGDAGAFASADAAEQPGAGPEPHRDEIVDRQREGSIEIGGLRQVGDPGFRAARQPDVAGEGPQRPDDALEECRLAGTVRADDRRQAPGRDLPVEMMDGRPAPVAERQVVEADGGRCSHVSRSSEGREPRSRPKALRRRSAAARPRGAKARSSARPRSRAEHGNAVRGPWECSNITFQAGCTTRLRLCAAQKLGWYWYSHVSESTASRLRR